jgi:hypothetical protein
MATNTDIIDSPALNQLIAQYLNSRAQLRGLSIDEKRRAIENFKASLLSSMERDPEAELSPANAIASAEQIFTTASQPAHAQGAGAEMLNSMFFSGVAEREQRAQQLERNRIDAANAALRAQQRQDADRVGIDPFRGERVFAGPTGGIGTQKVQPRTEGGPYPVGGIGTRKIRDPIPRRPRRGTIEEIVGERPYTLPEGARRRQGTIEDIVGGRPYTLPEGARRRQDTIEEIVGERPYTLPEGARRRQGTIEEIVGERPYTLPEGARRRQGTIEEIVGERPYTLPEVARPRPEVAQFPEMSEEDFHYLVRRPKQQRDFLASQYAQRQRVGRPPPFTKRQPQPSPVRREEATHAPIDQASRDALVEILRSDEGMAMATTPRQRAGETLDVRPRNPFDRGRGSNADILAANYARMAMDAENEAALKRLYDSRRLATSYARGGLVIDPRGIGSLREDRG